MQRARWSARTRRRGSVDVSTADAGIIALMADGGAGPSGSIADAKTAVGASGRSRVDMSSSSDGRPRTLLVAAVRSGRGVAASSSGTECVIGVADDGPATFGDGLAAGDVRPVKLDSLDGVKFDFGLFETSDAGLPAPNNTD